LNRNVFKLCSQYVLMVMVGTVGLSLLFTTVYQYAVVGNSM
jgi:hypothetical protein